MLSTVHMWLPKVVYRCYCAGSVREVQGEKFFPRITSSVRVSVLLFVPGMTAIQNGDCFDSGSRDRDRSTAFRLCVNVVSTVLFFHVGINVCMNKFYVGIKHAVDEERTSLVQRGEKRRYNKKSQVTSYSAP